MKLSRLGLSGVLLALLALNASAQAIWKWRDHDGRIQISDRAPPIDVPDKDILQRPGGNRPTSSSQPLEASSDALMPGAPAASMPAVDGELEARKRKLMAEQAAQKQAKAAAEKDKASAAKAENCRRARNQLRLMESGARVARPNEQGEREIMDDQARAQEAQRARDLVNANCSGD